MKSASRTLLVLTIVGFVAAIVTGIVANAWRGNAFAGARELQAAADMAAMSNLLTTLAGAGVVGLLVVWAVAQQVKDGR